MNRQDAKDASRELNGPGAEIGGVASAVIEAALDGSLSCQSVSLSPSHLRSLGDPGVLAVPLKGPA